MKNYYEAVKMLEELFDKLNGKFYGGELVKPIITVLPDSTKSSFGWCSTKKIWKAGEEDYYEINICAEQLNRSMKDITATLLHEMAHLYNIEHEIKDCSNGYYHNKSFKETAEAHGLIIDKAPRYGWTVTSLKEDTAKWVEENIEIEKIDLVRIAPSKQAAKPVARKNRYKYYECPCCKKKMYSIYEISAKCIDCDEEFERYK